MPGPHRFLGAVLAGGRSTRFGADKTAATVGGVPLVERAARTLGEVLPEVVVVGSGASPAAAGPHGRALLRDLREGCGPLGGIEAALAGAEAAGLHGAFVLACDLPLVGPDVVRAVLRALGDADAAAPARHAEPGCEPLCAVYHASCLAPARALLDEGTRAAHRLFGRVRGVTVPLPGADFLNVNTPEDRDRAERRLTARGG